MIHCTGTIRYVRASLATIAVAFVPVVVQAQAAAVAASRPDSIRSLYFRAGAGVDLNWRDGNTANGMIGGEWRRPGSRLGARFDVDYFRREHQYPSSVLTSCIGACIKGNATQLVGGSIGGQFDLTTTRFRPYVFSGVGLYHANFDQVTNVRCDKQAACVLTPGDFSTLRTQSISVGLHSGLGLSLRAGRSLLFTEFRLQTLTNAPLLNWHAPVTFGVRF